MNNGGYIIRKLREISNNNSINSYQKLLLVNELFEDTKNTRDKKEYVDIIKNSIYIKNIIDSIKVEEFDKVLANENINYILEDYENFQCNQFDYEFNMRSSELDELAAFYNEYYPKVPTAKENQELLLKAKKGDKKARDELINSNWKLVFSIALKFQGNGLDIVDMFQEGNAGFMKAINNYKIDKKASIATYAYLWIKQYIQRAIYEGASLIRYPFAVNEKKRKIESTINKLRAEFNREPTIKEVAASLLLDEKTVEELLYLPIANSSLNEPFSDDEDYSLKDVIPDETMTPIEEILDNNFLKEKIEKYLESMDERHAEILKLRYGFYNDMQYTLEEIGKTLNLTRERIRQLENRAKTNLRKIIEKDNEITDIIECEAEEDKIDLKIPTEKYATNIYEYYFTCSKEDIDLAISCLNDDMKRVALLVFTDNCSKEDKDMFVKKVNRIIVSRLKDLIICKDKKYEYVKKVQNKIKEYEKNTKKKDINSIYEYYDDYTKEDVDLALTTVTEKVRIAHEKRFNTETCDKITRRQFSYNGATSMKSKLDHIRRKRTLELIDCIENNKEDIDLSDDIKNILISSLRLGFIDDKIFSVEQVSKIFDMDKEDVDTVLNSNIKLYGKSNIKDMSSIIYEKYKKHNNYTKVKTKK